MTDRHTDDGQTPITKMAFRQYIHAALSIIVTKFSSLLSHQMDKSDS
jgi:hypothetical protein